MLIKQSLKTIGFDYRTEHDPMIEMEKIKLKIKKKKLNLDHFLEF